MKKLAHQFLTYTFYAAIVGIVFWSCNQSVPPVAPTTQIWEYKVVYTPVSDSAANTGSSVKVDEAALAAAGKDGWELASSYEEYNTVFPNFSADQKIVTGIESNVRPIQLVLLFKRPLVAK